MFNWRGFVCGVLAGTVGIHILSSREAKTVYAHVGAAILHGKDDIVKQGQILQENCADIGARAKKINEESYAKERESMISNVYEKKAEQEAAQAESAQ